MEELRKVISTDEHYISSTVTPERRLLTAILNRAVLDFLGNSKEDVEKAGIWLFNKETVGDEFSFEWICDNLDLDAENILSELLYRKCMNSSQGNICNKYEDFSSHCVCEAA